MTAYARPRWAFLTGFAEGDSGWGADPGGYNDVARNLDSLLHPVLQTFAPTNTPPGSPADGDGYLVGASPTGAWATGFSGTLAFWDDTTSEWVSAGPAQAGLLAWGDDVQELRVYDEVDSVFITPGNAKKTFSYATLVSGTPATSATVASFLVPGETTDVFVFSPESQARPGTRPSGSTTLTLFSTDLAGTPIEVGTVVLTTSAILNNVVPHATNRVAGGDIVTVVTPGAINGVADIYLAFSFAKDTD